MLLIETNISDTIIISKTYYSLSNIFKTLGFVLSSRDVVEKFTPRRVISQQILIEAQKTSLVPHSSGTLIALITDNSSISSCATVGFLITVSVHHFSCKRCIMEFNCCLTLVCLELYCTFIYSLW